MSDITNNLNDAIAQVQAIEASYDAPKTEAKAPDPEPVNDDVAQTEEVSDNVDQSEGVDAEAEAQGDDESDTVEAEAEPVEAPQWWDAEAKKHFASLTPEAQAVVKAQEDKREEVVAKVKTEAKEASAQARAEAVKAKELSDRLAAAMTDERKAFDEYYTDIDWEAYVDQDPIAAQKDWLKYQSGLQRFNKLETDRAAAEQLHRETFMREEAAKLSEIAPEIAGNGETLSAIGQYIMKVAPDVPKENLLTLSAAEITIAHKAMMYDKMMAEATSKSAPPKTTQTPPAKVVPSKGNPKQGTSASREVTQIKNRLAQTGSIDDAARLIAKLGY